jgi:hypothetical protein
MTNPSVLDTDKQDMFLTFLIDKEKKLLKESDCKAIKTQKKTFYCEFGKIVYSFRYIKKEGQTCFSPLRQYLCIGGPYQNMSFDFKAKLIMKATRTTYQKAVEDIRDSFCFSMSKKTLNNYVIKTKDYDVTQEPAEEQNILIGDSTKIRNGKGGHHEALALISLDYETNDSSLTAFGINESAKAMSEKINITKYKAFVGDGDLALRNFFKEKIPFHLCHHHAINDVSFFLWKDGMKKELRLPIERKFKAALYTLQNSTKKYWKTNKPGRLVNRIIRTRKVLTSLAAELTTLEKFQAARYIMDHRDHMLTAAKLALVGIKCPWTTNHAERLMQEIGIRTKKKGMNWTEKGLKAMLNLVLKRYFLPQNRRNYKEICDFNPQVIES